MTHDEFHSVVLIVANVISIRYWNYINYPHTPQEFAILSAYDMPDGIHKELIDMGFTFGEGGDYRINKTESI